MRLAEAIELIRLLWTEERVDFEGEYYTHRARRSTTAPTSRCRSTSPRRARWRPSSPAASATASSAPAARTRRSTTSCSATSRRAPRGAGRDPAAIRRMIEIKVSYDRDRERAFANTHSWAALALTPEQKEGVEDPIEMERLADANVDQAPTPLHLSDDPEEVVEQIARLHRARLRRSCVLHAPGDDQARFLEQFAADVLPLLRDRFHRIEPRGSCHVHVRRQPRDRTRDRGAGRRATAPRWR